MRTCQRSCHWHCSICRVMGVYSIQVSLLTFRFPPRAPVCLFRALPRPGRCAAASATRPVASRVLEAHTALLLGLSSLGLRPEPDRWTEAPTAPAALTAPAVPTPSAPRLLQLA